MRPAQIISLMDLGATDLRRCATTTTTSTSATRRSPAVARRVQQLAQVLKPEQWERLIDRLGEIENPKVPAKPSDASLPADRGSAAHRGE